MNAKNLIKDLSAYNSWANLQVIIWLQNSTPEILTQKIPSSFSTIKSTFLHIWNAERFWFSFLQKKDFEPFRKDFEENYKSFFDGIHKQSFDLEMFVNSLSEVELEEEYTINTPWLKGTKPCNIFIQHAINHSTYHRGQLITLGRIAGLENPPNTDFLKFEIKDL